MSRHKGCQRGKRGDLGRSEEERKQRGKQVEERKRTQGDTKGCSNSPLFSVSGQEGEKVTLVCNYLVTSGASSERGIK